jgi:hypothetical protein
MLRFGKQSGQGRSDPCTGFGVYIPDDLALLGGEKANRACTWSTLVYFTAITVLKCMAEASAI